MRTYKFENGTIFVHGDINKERLEKATIQFIKKAQQYKTSQKRENS